MTETATASVNGEKTGTGGQTIVPHLWFDDQALEAAEFYASIFDDSEIRHVARFGKEGFEVHGQPEGTVMTVDFHLGDYRIIALNGGPLFSFTPAISLFVTLETADEVDRVCERLLEGGSVLVELGSYPWSDRYAWVRDRFGLTWQLLRGELEGVHGRRFVPCLSFGGDRPRARAAMERYVGIFPDSRIDDVSTFGDMGQEPSDAVAHAQFFLDSQLLMAQDERMHGQDFNEAFSLLVEVQGQEEIDHYWNELVRGGEPGQCGWLKDEFGVSWQVFPAELGQMLQSSDPERVARVTNVFLAMQKFDLGELQAAFEGS